MSRGREKEAGDVTVKEAIQGRGEEPGNKKKGKGGEEIAECEEQEKRTADVSWRQERRKREKKKKKRSV